MISRKLIGIIFTLPKTPSTAPHVPVGEPVNEGLYLPAGVGGIIFRQPGVHLDNQLVELGDYPPVEFGIR